MTTIAETIRWLHADAGASPFGPAAASPGRLRPLPAAGSNPGALGGWCFVPDGVTDMALVVVLHGCTQTAQGYDRGAGWSDLASRHGFAVLFPEQQRSNNPNLCFNWFEPEDTRRGGGEAESIRQMIAAMIDRHPINRARVFVTGLSAGGAMASVMLATSPELFAGGGIIAGLPHGAAASVSEALRRMRGRGHPAGGVYTDRVRAASGHDGPWPRIAVWHGDRDQTVSPDNADRIVDQWRGLHRVGVAPDRSEMVDGHVRSVWLDRDGAAVIEAYRIAGMGHGTPLKTDGPDGCGVAGPHMLEAGISSTRRLAASWGLLDGALPARAPAPCGTEPRQAGARRTTSTVQDSIESALRAAGLMK